MTWRARNGLCAAVLFAAALLAAPAAHAVVPDEVLDDPALEQRARGLSAQLRCMVCQNQSIDDSDAELARDLRLLVRERIEAGDSDAEVIDFVVARYGEFVLLKPRFNARNVLLWASPVLLLVAGGTIAVWSLRTRRRGGVDALTQEERSRLDAMLDRRE